MTAPSRACRLDLVRTARGQLPTAYGAQTGAHFLGIFWQTYIPRDAAHAKSPLLPDADTIDVSGNILIVGFHVAFSFN